MYVATSEEKAKKSLEPPAEKYTQQIGFRSFFSDKCLLRTYCVSADMEGVALNKPDKTLVERKRQRRSDASCLFNENLE